jgi:outer membrane receptor protein involved in Fe transport
MHAHTLVVALLSQLAAAPPSADNRTVISPSRIPASAFDSDRSQAWIGEEQIGEDVAVDVPEVLAAIPGVTVQRTTLAAGAPILRGLIGPSNLLVIDGVRYGLSTNRTGPNQYMGLVDPSALARVGVLLGPSALLYGSDALGGVVEFETRDVPDHDGVEGFVQTRLSSADLGVEGAGELGGRSGPIGGRVGIGVRRHALLRTGGGEKVPLSETLQSRWPRAREARPRRRLVAGRWLARLGGQGHRPHRRPRRGRRAAVNSTADHLAWLLLERATPRRGAGLAVSARLSPAHRRDRPRALPDHRRHRGRPRRLRQLRAGPAPLAGLQLGPDPGAHRDGQPARAVAR